MLCALAGVDPPLRVLRITRNFARAGQIVNYSSTKDTKFKKQNIRNLRALRAFVVKNSFPFGFVGAALGYLSLCGESFRLFEANADVEE